MSSHDDRGWPDREVAAIAERQATMISHAQLRELGASRDSIERARRRGRLHAVHVGVYSLVPARARPPEAAAHAALLACGDDAVLSHNAAAGVHGFELPGRRPREVHVTVPPHGRGRGRSGIRVHRSRDLDRGEVVRTRGLRVTSIPRTVIDMAGALDRHGLEALVDQALRRTSRTQLRRACARHRRRGGVGLLRAMLDPARPSREARSRTETRLRRTFERGGLPSPEGNVPIGGLEPDFLWREFSLICEYDSEAYHFGPAGYRRTWQRHRVFQAAGYTVVHFTSEDIACPERVLVHMTVALVRAGWSPGWAN